MVAAAKEGDPQQCEAFHMGVSRFSAAALEAATHDYQVPPRK